MPAHGIFSTRGRVKDFVVCGSALLVKENRFAIVATISSTCRPSSSFDSINWLSPPSISCSSHPSPPILPFPPFLSLFSLAPAPVKAFPHRSPRTRQLLRLLKTGASTLSENLSASYSSSSALTPPTQQITASTSPLSYSAMDTHRSFTLTNSHFPFVRSTSLTVSPSPSGESYSSCGIQTSITRRRAGRQRDARESGYETLLSMGVYLCVQPRLACS